MITLSQTSPDDGQRRTRAGALERVRSAAPPLVDWMPGAVIWAVLMAASAYLQLTLHEWATPTHINLVTSIFAGGGLVAFPMALWAARLLAQRRSPEARFAAMVVCLTVLTVGLTALFYAFDYRAYYSEWHDNAFTMRWVFELIFTTLAACYQFLVMGLRLFFPLGFVALAAAGLWFARHAH